MDRITVVSFLGLFFFSGCSQGTPHNHAATPAAPAGNETSCSISEDTPPTSGQVFGSVFSENRHRNPSWRRYANTAEVQRAADAGEIDDTASLWTPPDGTLQVTMTQGDDHAVLTLNYCFRADGTLAESVLTLGAVNGVHPDPEMKIGPISRTTRRTFDRCGAQVAEQVGPLLLMNGKSAPERTAVMDRHNPQYATSATCLSLS